MRNELWPLLGALFSPGESEGKGSIESRNVRVDATDYDYQVYALANTKDNLPVIIFLHGIRERGRGGFVPTEGALGAVIRSYFAQIPAIVLLPQCRPENYWFDPPMEQMVTGALEQTLDEFTADPNRVYLIGVSLGGYGVWHFASQYPGRFAALVSICGGSPVPDGDRFASVACKVGRTPAWLFHGAADRVVPVTESREIFKALEANGGYVKYSEYAGVGHNVWLNVLGEEELMPWLLAQRLDS